MRLSATWCNACTSLPNRVSSGDALGDVDQTCTKLSDGQMSMWFEASTVECLADSKCGGEIG